MYLLRHSFKERWPSGLRRTPGKGVYGELYREFESRPLRHKKSLVSQGVSHCLHIREFWRMLLYFLSKRVTFATTFLICEVRILYFLSPISKNRDMENLPTSHGERLVLQRLLPVK